MSYSPIEDMLAEVPWLRRFAAGLVRSATDADDLVQDTLRTALVAERPSAPVRSFLAGVARNLARDRRRRDVRRAEREARHAQERTAHVAAAADEDAWRLDLLRTLLEELSALPAAQRRAITGRYLDELEPAEIAARDGVSPASVRAQLSRGLAALRARLDRHGGRESWLACLGPWALGGAFPLTVPDPSPITASSSHPALPAAGSATNPLLAGLAGLAVMKLSVLLAVPALLAAGLWWYQRDLAPPSLEESRLSGLASADPVEPATLEQPANRGATARTVVAADLPSVTTSVAAEPLVVPSTAQLVDLLTGEPVPDMEVVLQCPESGARAGRTLTSDEHGTLALPLDLACSGGEVRVVEQDRTSDLSSGPLRHTRLPFPFLEPIPVHVGPTFRLELPDDLRADPGRLVARFRAQDDARSFDDPEAHVRAGRTGCTPWIRFPRAVTELEGALFEVVLEDPLGGRRARIPVRRTRGIEPVPLRPVFEPGGAVRFVLDVEGAAQAPALKVDLDPVGHEVGDDVQLRLFTNHHAADGTVSGTLSMIPPGDYRWTLLGTGAGAEGSITVVAGETVEVALGEEVLGSTFDSEVLLDARATPEADPTQWLVMVTSEDEPGAGFMSRARSVEGQPGRYRIPLKSLSTGSWRVVVNAPAEVSLAPGSVIVTPGAPPEVLRTSPASTVSLTLTVLDDATGETLTDATAVVIVVPSDAIEFRGVDQERTRLYTDRLPGDGPVDVFVRAPGRRGVLLRHDATRDPASRTVRLTRGWRSRVLVLDATKLEPVGGIEVAVDGERAGTTAADGWCWIEGDEPPQRVEVARGHPSLEVIMSPYDLGMDTETALDPPTGFIFLLAPRAADGDR